MVCGLVTDLYDGAVGAVLLYPHDVALCYAGYADIAAFVRRVFVVLDGDTKHR